MVSSLIHDSDIAIDFLKWLYPRGPWCLVAIHPDQQDIRAATFYPTPTDTDTVGDAKQYEGKLRVWLEQHASWNIYYHVNRPLRDMHKKAERRDIDDVCFFHVDVDPRANENLDAENERIRKVLVDNLPAGIPKPSCVVFSGGGYNALWRLEEPLSVAGDESKAEEIKRYNLQLEITLGGDNCHDVTRILRVPGTINWPNERKRKKGRVPRRSEIVYKNDNAYPVVKFVAAPPVQGKQEAGLVAGGGTPVKVSGNVARLNHVSELGEKVHPRTKVLIVNGHDPDDPNRWSSRSELLFHVCCDLVRAGCSDEQIYAVITDPGFLISASVLDKGSGAERYAIRQIQRAKEEVIDPHLRGLNEKHAVISNLGGKCRVAEEVVDYALDRPRLTFQSFDDFRNRYMHVRVQAGTNKDGEPRMVSLGQWWLQHPNRRQFETIVFAPGREVQNAYNLWRGFACEARPGDKHQSFLNHMHDNVCAGNREHFEYLVRWMARAVQQPDTPGEVAVVFRGDQGTGKGTIAREFGMLWGRHYIQISDPKHLVGSFNSHLRDAVVVFADEAFYAGDKKHESILKTLITEELLVIEGKGRDAETSRNFVHLMMASNSTWVVPAGINERRYFVLDVLPAHMQDTKYFEKIRQDMNNGGRENLLHHLLTMDLRNWDVRTVPRTSALQDQKLLSLSTEQEWWFQKLQNGQLLREHVGWSQPVFKEDLLDDYLRYAQKLGVQRRATATALGRFIHTVVPSGPRSRQHTRQYQNDAGIRMTERAYAYEFPPLTECREFWDQKYGGPYQWPSHDDNPGVEQLGGHF